MVHVSDMCTSADPLECYCCCSHSHPPTLTRLPTEILLLVMLRLPTVQDLWHLAQTCKLFYRIYDTCDNLWEQRLINDLRVDYTGAAAARLNPGQALKDVYGRLFPHRWARSGIWMGNLRQFGTLVISSYNYDRQTFQFHQCVCVSKDTLAEELATNAGMELDPGDTTSVRSITAADTGTTQSSPYTEQTDYEFLGRAHRFEWINNHHLTTTLEFVPRLNVMDPDGALVEINPDKVDYQDWETLQLLNYNAHEGIVVSLSRVTQDLVSSGSNSNNSIPTFTSDPANSVSENFASSSSYASASSTVGSNGFGTSSTSTSGYHSDPWPPHYIPALERTSGVQVMPFEPTSSGDSGTGSRDDDDIKKKQFSDNLIRIYKGVLLRTAQRSSTLVQYFGHNHNLRNYQRSMETFYRLDDPGLLRASQKLPFKGLWVCDCLEEHHMGLFVLITQSPDCPERLKAINVTAGITVPRGEVHFSVDDLNNRRRRPDKYLNWGDKDVVQCRIQVSGISYHAPIYVPGELVIINDNCLAMCRPLRGAYANRVNNSASVPVPESSNSTDTSSVASTTSSSDTLPFSQSQSTIASAVSSQLLLDSLNDTESDLVFFKRLKYDWTQSLTKQLRLEQPILPD